MINLAYKRGNFMQKAPSEMIGRGFLYASVNVYRRSMTSAFGYFFLSKRKSEILKLRFV